MLFKVAVELSKLNSVVAANSNISTETMMELNDICSNEVSENNGIIDFERAFYKFNEG
jgi:hypothetical protein